MFLSYLKIIFHTDDSDVKVSVYLKIMFHMNDSGDDVSVISKDYVPHG